MKRTIAFLLILVMALSLLAVPAVSGAEKIVYGDADGDGEVTAIDVTVVMRHTVHILTLTGDRLKAATVSGDDELTIVDVTWIQRKVVKMIDKFPVEENEPENPDRDTLVVYFSRTGNTRPLAQYAAEYLDADIFEIEAAVPYTDADIAYYTNCRADREQSDPTARPEIAGAVEDMEQYSTVVIAYPIWHGQAPKIIYTFLESYDMADKTIIPFCTSASSPIGSSDDNLHPLAPDSTWKDGRRFAAGTSSDVIEAWLDEIGF